MQRYIYNVKQCLQRVGPHFTCNSFQVFQYFFIQTFKGSLILEAILNYLYMVIFEVFSSSFWVIDCIESFLSLESCFLDFSYCIIKGIELYKPYSMKLLQNVYHY